MASQGPFNGSSAVSVAPGDEPWVTPENALVSADSYALAVFNPFLSDTFTEHLQVTGFNFTIPSTATINGVLVEIERHADAAPITDINIQLMIGGTASGQNKADVSSNWPSSDAYASYGSAVDLWLLTLTPAIVNSSTFGVDVQAINPVGTAFVDHVRITIFYTDGNPVSVTGTTTYHSLLQAYPELQFQYEDFIEKRKARPRDARQGPVP